MPNFTAKLSDPGSWSYNPHYNIKMLVETVLLKILANTVPKCQGYHKAANYIFSALPVEYSHYFISLGLEFVQIAVLFGWFFKIIP